MIVPKLVALTANLPAVTIKGNAWPSLVTSGTVDLPVVSQSCLKVTALIDAHGAGAWSDPTPFKTWLSGVGAASLWYLDDVGSLVHDYKDGNEGVIGGPTYLRQQPSLLPNGEGTSTYLGSGDIGAIPPAANLDVTSDFTLMAWVQAGAGQWNPIALKDDGTDGYGITWQDSAHVAGLCRLGGVASTMSRDAGSPGVPGWLVFRNIAGTCSIWFNGVKIGADAVLGPAGKTGAYFSLSADPGTGVYFVGYLQYEAAVPRGLSDAEIAAGWAAANTAATPTPTIAALSSLTWNGDAMTLVRSGGSVTPGTNPEMWAEEWILVNPDAGLRSLVATHGAGTQASGTRNTVLIVELWQNVDPLNPIGGSALANGQGSLAGISVPSGAGQAVTDALAVRTTFHPAALGGQFLTAFDTQGTGAAGVFAIGSHRDGDGVTAMGWRAGLTPGVWLELGLSLRGPDGPGATITPGAKIAGISVGGIGIPSRVVSFGIMELIKELLLQTTQLYTSEHTIQLANDDNCIVKMSRGLDWYGKTLEITMDAQVVWRGYIISIQPEPSTNTVYITARSVMQKGAESSVTGTGTAVNPADAILALLRQAFTDDQLDLAAIRLAGQAARQAGATIDYTIAAGSNATCMSAIQSISVLCGIAVYETYGKITAKAWTPYQGSGSNLGFELNDANVREWGKLEYDTTLFNPGVDVPYTGGLGVALEDRESARRNGLLDPATGKSLRRYAMPSSGFISHDIASARYFGGLYLSMAGDRCRKIPVTMGREANGIRLGDRFPVTQATRMELDGLPMEVYEIHQDIDSRLWTLNLREVFAA